MDLFTGLHDDMITTSIHISDEWDKLLYPTYRKLDEVMTLVEERRKTNVVYPIEGEVLKVFKLIEPSEIKVVIIGQEPYSNNNANGIAFASANSMPSSLVEILKAIQNNYPEGQDELKSKVTLKFPAKRDLMYLIEQGVFLLNTTLTVDENTSCSHSNFGWKTFTNYVIVKLAEEYPNIVWMLWGNRAKSYSSKIRAIDSKCNIITDNQLPASNRSEAVWQTNCFKDCNSILEELGKTPILWI